MKHFLKIPLSVLAKMLCRECLLKMSMLKLDDNGEFEDIELCAECERKTKEWSEL